MLHQLLTDFWERAALLLLIFAMGFIAEQLIPAERRVDIPGALLNCMVGFFLMAGEAIAAMIVASAFVKLPGSGLSSFMAIPDRGSILKSAVSPSRGWRCAIFFIIGFIACNTPRSGFGQSMQCTTATKV